jgi:hypothetical protein
MKNEFVFITSGVTNSFLYSEETTLPFDVSITSKSQIIPITTTYEGVYSF